MLRTRLVETSLLLQARDFVLYQQLATFQFHDLKIVDRRVRTGLAKLFFQGPVPSFQFRKMRFYGHVGGFSSASCCLTPSFYTVAARFRSGFSLCNAAIHPMREHVHSKPPRLNSCEQTEILLPRVAAVAMTKEEEREFREQLARLQQEHRDLDA